MSDRLRLAVLAALSSTPINHPSVALRASRIVLGNILVRIRAHRLGELVDLPAEREIRRALAAHGLACKMMGASI